MGNKGSRSKMDDEDARLSRQPTHSPSRVETDGSLTFGFEIFSYHGGAPPYRGYHYSQDDLITVPENATWDDLANAIKLRVDPANRTDLRIIMYNTRDANWNGVNIRGQSASLSGLVGDSNLSFRVYKPFARGMVDIGVFVPVMQQDLEDASISTESTVTLRNNPKNVDMEPGALEHLIYSLRGSNEAAFAVAERPASVRREALHKIIRFAEGVYANPELSSHPITVADGDLKINLTLPDLEEFLGAEAVKEMTTMFGETIDEVIVRRCDGIGRCIDFHVDYSMKTLQMALNDDQEYEGGRLVYVTGGVLHTPTRSAGTITMHGWDIVHGVTTLQKGVRYGLVLLHHTDYGILH